MSRSGSTGSDRFRNQRGTTGTGSTVPVVRQGTGTTGQLASSGIIDAEFSTSRKLDPLTPLQQDLASVLTRMLIAEFRRVGLAAPKGNEAETGGGPPNDASGSLRSPLRKRKKRNCAVT